ncbi:MAG: nitrate/nitrite transporter NrtS [SAR324 cluster bacterium]|nr:nitrate/nitrite transporter NrtS [SAR324 cluster bacterium]
MNQTATPDFFELAFSDGTPQKAVMTALVVGTILAIINHGDFILKGESINYFKILLTYCVPYCVTTWGAIHGKRVRLS